MPGDVTSYTVFAGARRIASGDRTTAMHAMKRAADSGEEKLLAFEDASGRQVDFDFRERPEEPASRPGRGRPKLGVVAREITLLPRHWEWLAEQPGGASAAVRRLVEQARKASLGADESRTARDAAYRVMVALAGDLPNFEEAVRGLYGGDLAKVTAIVAAWPADVATYISARLEAVHAAGDRA